MFSSFSTHTYLFHDLTDRLANMCGVEILTFDCGHNKRTSKPRLCGAHGTTREHTHADVEVYCGKKCYTCEQGQTK